MSDFLSLFSVSEPKTTIGKVRSTVGSESMIVGMHSAYTDGRDNTTREMGSWTVTNVEAKEDAMKVQRGEQVIQADQRVLKLIYRLEGYYVNNSTPTSLKFWAIVSPLNRDHLPEVQSLVIICRVVDTGSVSRYCGPGDGAKVGNDWVITLADKSRIEESGKPQMATLDHTMFREFREMMEDELYEETSVKKNVIVDDFAEILGIKGALEEVKAALWEAAINAFNAQFGAQKPDIDHLACFQTPCPDCARTRV
jgi:hypothetical protein